jgi:hypothetical protein
MMPDVEPAHPGNLAGMNNGSYNSLGIDKHCPECGERYGFAKFSVLGGNDTPGDWSPI